MSEAVEEVVVETPPLDEGAKVKKWIMRMAAIMVVAIIATVGACYMLFAPSGEMNPEDIAAAQIADGVSDITAGSDLIEVPFEPSFSVTNSKADLAADVHLSFDLVAGVAAKNESTFRQAVDVDYRSRLRQAISEIARSAALEDLQDPDLNQLKRRIKEDLNKTLQSSYVVEIIIPKMQVHRQ